MKEPRNFELSNWNPCLRNSELPKYRKPNRFYNAVKNKLTIRINFFSKKSIKERISLTEIDRCWFEQTEVRYLPLAVILTRIDKLISPCFLMTVCLKNRTKIKLLIDILHEENGCSNTIKAIRKNSNNNGTSLKSAQ
ncbi:hypothetical protein X798_01736 [Onchocerca flexuosa]|uniref:Uncharacterized protein n=1 Tax=Onchocerca flexuosa TaxID=387005 RepID=A0A238C2P7_9BILA|nr:hypothetical protein X798_01736 [Onchocerca flexuosa]